MSKFDDMTRKWDEIPVRPERPMAFDATKESFPDLSRYLKRINK